jgi:hypothetical protein
MLAIPDIDRASMAFGNIKHMPKYETLPEAFQDWHYEPHCRAISDWFYSGAKACPNGIEMKGTKYIAKDGVEAGKALAAIKAVMASWEPKHEHKIAACGYMLSEWFQKAENETGK